jgi:hypothetical protein
VSDVEHRLIASAREVVVLSADGNRSRDHARRAAAALIERETGAFVVVDHDGSVVGLDKLSAAQMRSRGWVRVDELERAVHDARAAVDS